MDHSNSNKNGNINNSNNLRNNIKKTRWGRGKNKSHENFLIFNNNVAGLNSKIESFSNIIENIDTSVFLLQETHFKRKGGSN